MFEDNLKRQQDPEFPQQMISGILLEYRPQRIQGVGNEGLTQQMCTSNCLGNSNLRT